MAGIQWLSSWLEQIKNAGGGGGDTDANFEALVAGTLSGDVRYEGSSIRRSAFMYSDNDDPLYLTADNVTSIGQNAFGYSNLAGLTAPNATTIGEYPVSNALKLEYINIPKVTGNVNASFSVNAPNFMWAAINSMPELRSSLFTSCPNLRVVALGGASPSRTITYYGGWAPSSGSLRYILVPRDLVSAYSTWGGFPAGSQPTALALEDYTVDGTLTGLIDPAKIAPLLV